MLAVKGMIKGNTVVVEGDDIRNYDGKEVIVTILDDPYRQLQRGKLNLDRFVKPSERGKNADEYISN